MMSTQSHNTPHTFQALSPTMANCRAFAQVLLFFALSCQAAATYAPVPAKEDFLGCLMKEIPARLLYAKSSPDYPTVLAQTIRNSRWSTQQNVKPLYIITPTNASHIQSAVVCGRRHGVRLRVRSGGHDYEGLSYRSEKPETFAVVDLNKMRAVVVDGYARTAWVESGAQLGELYYAIAKNSPVLAFPAGVCPSIGVGGNFAGGGFGMLLRKYGIAAENVIDVKVVDPDGKLLDKSSMSADHFWAVRGGGGESFGIVVSWQVKLMPVPPTVTVFKIPKTVQEGAVDLVNKWQLVGPALPGDLMIRVIAAGNTATFEALYLGTCKTLTPLMSSQFPELGMNPYHCNEMPWIKSVPFIHLGKQAGLDDLLNRNNTFKPFAEYKSDYVYQPFPKPVWEQIFGWLAKPGAGIMIMDPYGATISATPEAATPFPHRQGVLFNIQYVNYWFAEPAGAAPLQWSKDIYNFMEPYVSKNPRQAYANYRDIDLGRNEVVNDISTYSSGKVWGEKYFKSNFQRLAITKGKVDPQDYFRNEQSIPPLIEKY
ncbi:berberine bridge enzyme-like Cyn d 4 [Triticum aestivum]|nr:berberine bridge enzyme-like Cyn d 4 [Triticum aestivum]